MRQNAAAKNRDRFDAIQTSAQTKVLSYGDNSQTLVSRQKVHIDANPWDEGEQQRRTYGLESTNPCRCGSNSSD